MHNAYGSGAMAFYRRVHRRNDPRPKCDQCGKRDKYGLIDHLCGACFDLKIENNKLIKKES